jgi:hypothetical protein
MIMYQCGIPRKVARPSELLHAYADLSPRSSAALAEAGSRLLRLFGKHFRSSCMPWYMPRRLEKTVFILPIFSRMYSDHEVARFLLLQCSIFVYINFSDIYIYKGSKTQINTFNLHLFSNLERFCLKKVIFQILQKPASRVQRLHQNAYHL